MMYTHCKILYIINWSFVRRVHWTLDAERLLALENMDCKQVCTDVRETVFIFARMLFLVFLKT